MGQECPPEAPVAPILARKIRESAKFAQIYKLGKGQGHPISPARDMSQMWQAAEGRQGSVLGQTVGETDR